MEVLQKVHRSNLKNYKVNRIGKGTQGNIYRILVDGFPAAVKDISNKNIFYRLLIGRWLLRNEYNIYLKLQGTPGIPHIYKIIERDGFIFEYIEGTPLSDFKKDASIPANFFSSLESLVKRIHDHGVVHSDLKHKKNILVGKDYQPYLIDFGASWIEGPPWNLPKRWLYRQFYQIDLNAVSKIRNRFKNGNPTDLDQENLTKRNFMERCSRIYQTIYRLISKKHKWKRRSRVS